MKFKPGMLGACVVVLALLGTVLIGYNLDVDEEVEYRTSYKTITNITSQFDYAPGDSFVQYNPAKNYSGYTPGTITFTESGTANQYGYIVTPGTHVSTTVDLSETSFYSTAGHEVNARSFVGVPYNNFWLLGGHRISVADILSHEGINYTQYPSGIDISLTYGDPYYFGGVSDPTVMMATPNLVTASNTSTFFSNSDIGTGVVYTSTDPNIGTNYLNGTPWYWLYSSAETSAHTSDGLSYTIHVSSNGETRTIYNGAVRDVSNISTTRIHWSDVACYTSNGGATSPEGPKAPFGGTNANYGNKQVIELYNQSLTPTAMLTISYDVGAVVKYIRISEGVQFVLPSDYPDSVDNSYTSTWNNGRENGSVSWVVRLGDTGTPVFQVSPTIKGYGNDILIQAYRVGSGDLAVFYADGVTHNTAVLGAWDTVLITFDAVNRTLTASPIVSFSNFQTFTASPSVFTVTDSFPVYANVSDTLTFEECVFTARNDQSVDFRFSVYETVVNMGFNTNIMVNPSLNPRALFLPLDYPNLRVSFDSVALYGNSVILNGVEYTVSNGQITVGANFVPISGMNVTYSDDSHMYVNDIDLGVVSDPTISFRGQWYFQARASYGYLEAVDVVDWDVGHWAIDMQQSILIYEALIIGGIIVAYFKKSLTTLDWAILIVAMFGGAVLF